MTLSNYRKQVAKAWNDYFVLNKSSIDFEVRKEIMESWERSKKYGIDVFKSLRATETDKINQAESMGKNSYLIDIARPYMVDMLNILKDMGIMIAIFDRNGCLLNGTSSIRSNLGLIDFSEKNIGTNGVGTCLATDKPFETFGEEYCCKELHGYAASSAPVHDAEGNIIGCISIAGYKNEMAFKTLGMTIAVAYAIENMVAISQKNNVINTHTYADIINRYVSDGILQIDREGIIISVNKSAQNILHADEKYLLGRNVTSIINSLDYKKHMLEGINFSNKEYFIRIENKPVKCKVTITNLKNNDEISGLLIVFREVSSFSNNKSEDMQNGLHTFDNLVAKSAAFSNTIKLAKVAANGKSNVLIMGESGTGKELIAQSIHNASPRRHNPFIAVNCGSLPVTLAETELFGYEGGSYTGSKKEGSIGKFELADGGTIFLDEIGEMPLSIQAALLRIIQDRTIVRVGGTKSKKVDILIIAATNKDLLEAIENNTFRMDLFYRLNVFNINVPPLRERREDIIPLVNYFINKYNNIFGTNITGISKEAEEILLRYDWRGNVRELENTIERTVQIAEGQVIDTYDIPAYILSSSKNNQGNAGYFENEIEKYENNILLNTLKKNKGNIKSTSEDLKISRVTIYRKLSKLGIDPEDYRK